MSRDRVLPHNVDVEGSILGGIIVRNEVLSLLATLEIDDFYDLKHKVVFEAIRNLEAAKTPIDVITLEAEIEKAGKLDAVGGVAFLGELALRVPTPDNVEAYAKIVTQHRISRDVIFLLGEMVERALSGEIEGESLVQEVTSRLLRVRTGDDVQVTTIGDLIRAEAKRTVADLEAKDRGEKVWTGVPTGFMAIDERVGGNPIGVSSLYIARPAQGKTTFAMAMCKAAKEIADVDSLLASYEDSGVYFGQRGLAQETGISTERIRARKITARAEASALIVAMGKRGRDELFMPCAGMPVEQLLRRVRRENLRRKHEGRKLIRQLVVDYIQKMPMPQWTRSRDEGIGYISMQLSTFAAQEDMAVVVMCQLNREIEKRDDHRPRISDIRESGALEQDGKFICGIYYPHTYDAQASTSLVQLLILKNAQGEAQGDVDLFWDRPTHSLYNSPLDHQVARSRRGGS